MPKKAAVANPIRKALKALEKREQIQKLAADRRVKGLRETEANVSNELLRLHGQQLPGLQAHVAQRRAMLNAVRKKLLANK